MPVRPEVHPEVRDRLGGPTGDPIASACKRTESVLLTIRCPQRSQLLTMSKARAIYRGSARPHVFSSLDCVFCVGERRCLKLFDTVKEHAFLKMDGEQRPDFDSRLLNWHRLSLSF